MHVCIVEDEKEQRDLLSQYLHRFQIESKCKVDISVFENGLDLVEEYEVGYDILFLDIDMPQMDGMTAAKKIREKDDYVIIVFVTNLVQYAIQGYSVNASNFILKPMNYFTFKEEMIKVINKLKIMTEYFLNIHVEGGLLHIPMSQITYIETYNRKLCIHTLTADYFCRETMKEIENQTNNTSFFRCHNVYIVNLMYVEEVEKNYVVVHGKNILVSRYKKKDLIDALTNYKGAII